jgi:hypothetical protein
MYSVLEVAASRQAEILAIGTLNEGALHAQLKDWYRRPGDRVEQAVDGFVVDLVRGDLLVEIQTGGFAPLRRKLELLTRQHPVRLVAPVPLVRTIIRLSDEGELLSARRSPRRGRIEDIFDRLVSIPSLLCCPRFELEVILSHQDELRVYRQGRRSGATAGSWPVAGSSRSNRAFASAAPRMPPACSRPACPNSSTPLSSPRQPQSSAGSPNRWPTAFEQWASSRRPANAATPSSTGASRHPRSPEESGRYQASQASLSQVPR